MSQFSGKQGRGAMRKRRIKKMVEAMQRNVKTLPERRRQYRLSLEGWMTDEEIDVYLARYGKGVCDSK